MLLRIHRSPLACQLAKAPLISASVLGNENLLTMAQSRKGLCALITLIFLLGLGLRLFRLSHQSFWPDEVGSINTARAAWKEIYRKSSEQNSLPTYFLLLRPIAGTSHAHAEVRTRLFSVIAGAFSVPLFIVVVYHWRRSWTTALLAGLLLAVNPLHLWYSQETRNYALMLFFGLCCLLAFEFARTRQKLPWWVCYWLFAVLTPATHKTGFLFPLLCALWHLRDARAGSLSLRGFAPHFLLGAVLMFLVVQPANPPLKEFSRPSSFLELPYTAMTFVGGYSFGPSQTEIQDFGATQAVSQHLVETGVLVAILCAIAEILLAHCRALLLGREMTLLVLGVGLAAVGALLSRFPFNVRYTLPGLIGFLALLACIPGSCRSGRFSQILISGIVAVNLWADCQWYFVDNYRKVDSRAVAAWLGQNEKNINSWTVLPDYMDENLKWYLEGNTNLASALLPAKNPYTTSFPPVPDVLMIARRHHLVKPDEVIAEYCKAAGAVQTNNSFAGFELYIRRGENSTNSANPPAGK